MAISGCASAPDEHEAPSSFVVTPGPGLGEADVSAAGFTIGEVSFLTVLPPATPEATHGGGVELRRLPGITEWLRPAERGLEHGFTVTELPTGDLTIDVSVSGAAAAAEVDGGIAFEDGLRYDKLHVFDASGRTLPSSMSWRAEERLIRIMVAETELAGAELPITVDPLIWTEWKAFDPTNQAAARFGESVAIVGDVNGDGFMDVVAGAPGYGTTFSGEGRAYLYLGTATGLASTPAWQIDPTDRAGSKFGFAVAPAGDINRDGKADVLIGAPGYRNDAGVASAGRVYLYLGTSTGLATTHNRIFEPNATQSLRFGSAVAAADFNGDGKRDIAIGMPGRRVQVTNNMTTPPTVTWEEYGGVWLYDGATFATANSQLQVVRGGRGGSSLAATDFNGDGRADLIVGQEVGGKAEVYVGTGANSGGWTHLLLHSSITDASSKLGISVAAGGRVDGDSFNDFAIGAPNATLTCSAPCTSTAGVGRVDVKKGGTANPPVSMGSSTIVAPASGSTSIRGIGTALAMGDLDADNFVDVVAGAPVSGTVYVFRGSPTGVALTPNQLLHDGVFAPNASSAFGWSLNAAGDINKDGINDLVVGAPTWKSGTAGSVAEGRIYVYLGKRDADRDEVIDTVDNCPTVANPDQLNSDGDAKGDACECLGVTCAAPNACQEAGVCASTTGSCSYAPKAACQVPPAWPSPELKTSELTATSVRLTWTPATHSVGVTGYRVLRDGNLVTTLPPATTTHVVTGLTQGTDYFFKVEASNLLGTTSENGPSAFVTTPWTTLPPTAAPLDITKPATMAELAAGIYTGPNAKQTGITAGKILPERATIIRGQVKDRAGAPMEGVIISILGDAGYGTTETDDRGIYDIVVNGGGSVVVKYEAVGYHSAQRQVETVWNEWTWADDLVMVPTPTTFSTITMNASGYQWAVGALESDSDGTRRGRVLVPPGTTATLTLANGTTQPAGTSIRLRATEFTVGDSGVEAMPAELPASSGYTYLVDWSADGAENVEFNQNVFVYVDNFIGFPASTSNPVPAGYYDSKSGQWVSEANGLVINFVDLEPGIMPPRARLDITGDGVADAVLAHGITDGERSAIAAEFAPGDSFWRVPADHFTSRDYNWGMYPPAGAGALVCTAEVEELPDEICEQLGSIIECEERILREEIPIAGTSQSLVYSSERVPGRRTSRRVKVQLSEDEIPESLHSIRMTVIVAGRRYFQEFPPRPNQTTWFEWDGRDANGRFVANSQHAFFTIAYRYKPQYSYTTAGFGTTQVIPLNFTGGQPVRGRNGTFIDYPVTFRRTLGTALSTPAQGLGGWSLSSQHVADPLRSRLYHGNGKRQTLPDVRGERVSWGGLGSTKTMTQGQDATKMRLTSVTTMTVGPDGTLYATGGWENNLGGSFSQVFKITPDRKYFSVVVSNNIPGMPSDGQIRGVALARDGAIFFGYKNRVFRLAPGGTPTVFAGTGGTSHGGDGGPALSASFAAIKDLDFGPDGSLYVAGSGRIRRIDTAGNVNTVIGLTPVGSNPDKLKATSLKTTADGFAVSQKTGNIYVCDPADQKLYRVTPDGMASRFAGKGTNGSGNPQQDGEGGLALNARIGGCIDIAVDDEEAVYFTEAHADNVRKVTPEGIIITAAGTWNVGGLGGQTMRTTNLNDPFGLAIGPNGDLFVRDSYEGDQRIHRGRSLRAWVAGGNVIAPDGSLLYELDANRRHVRTYSTLTNVAVETLAYDSRGFLATITDEHGNVTTIERNATTGMPTGIRGPYGHLTTLTLDGLGQLWKVTDPSGKLYELEYWPGQLLKSFRNRRGHKSTFTYDELGRLDTDVNAALGVHKLTPPDSSGFTKYESPGGRSKLIKTVVGNGLVSREVKGSDGLMTTAKGTHGGQRFVSPAGGTVDGYLALPDGTQVETRMSDDPRFGASSRFLSQVKTIIPGLAPFTVRVEREKVGFDPVTRAFTSLTERFIVNDTDSEFQSTDDHAVVQYTAATREVKLTSREKRVRTAKLDPKGRIVELQEPGQPPMTFGYDDSVAGKGRLKTVTARGRTTTFGYNDATGKGRVTSIIDSANQTTTFTYDANGRRRTATDASAATVAVDYDENGNVKSVTPPTKPAHTFEYSQTDDLILERAPTVGTQPTEWSYDPDADGVADYLQLPDDRVWDVGFDSAGRPATIVSPEGTTTLGYSPTTGLLTSATHSADVDLAFTYYGGLPRATSWSGEVTGSVELGYDAEHIVNSVRVGSGAAITYTHDKDGLPTGAGAMTVARDPAIGRVTGSTLGGVSETRGYNALGEVDVVESKFGATSLLRNGYTYDSLGRIDTRTETIAGISTVYDYDYDAAGRLWKVKVNGALRAEYLYDANGNRKSATISGVTTTAGTADAQDRLPSYGNRVYEYDAQGNIVKMTQGTQVTRYQFDSGSTLRGVTLPDGTQITYVLDAAGRRVGKKVNGVFAQRLIYLDDLRPVAEVDALGNVVAEFVYAANRHVPDYMVKGGVTYRLVTDHLGSVRAVVNTSSGAVVQRTDFDEFGNVMPGEVGVGFQPFGFAGGLRDLHSGLTHFGAREYDPVAGRWMSIDPIGFAGGQANLYQYVGDCPHQYIDPTGLWRFEDLSAGYGDALVGASVGFFAVPIGGGAFGGLPGLDDIVTGPALREQLGVGDAVDMESPEYAAGYVGGVITAICVDIKGLSRPQGIRLIRNLFGKNLKVVLFNLRSAGTGRPTYGILDIKWGKQGILRIEAHPIRRWMPSWFHLPHVHIDAIPRIAKWHLPWAP